MLTVAVEYLQKQYGDAAPLASTTQALQRRKSEKGSIRISCSLLRLKLRNQRLRNSDYIGRLNWQNDRHRSIVCARSGRIVNVHTSGIVVRK